MKNVISFGEFFIRFLQIAKILKDRRNPIPTGFPLLEKKSKSGKMISTYFV